MQPTSIRGIRRQIARKQSKGKPIPKWMIENLAKAIKAKGYDITDQSYWNDLLKLIEGPSKTGRPLIFQRPRHSA